MGLLDSLMVPTFASAPAPWDDYWFQPVGMTSAAGTRVSAESAMTISTVHACVRILAETVASVPLQIMERLTGDDRRRARDHPLWFVLHDQANEEMTSFEFREMMTAVMALRGNAYAEIIPGVRGFADQLVPLHPDSVRVERLTNRRLRYRISELGGASRDLPPERVFHLRGLSSDGITGRSVLSMARDSFGMALAQDQFAASYFSNGATPSGVLKYPQAPPETEDDETRLLKSWRENYSGPNAHRTAILYNGMEWQSISISPEDSQLLESRKFTVRDLARWFRMPPHLVNDLEQATFSNIEEMALEFVMYTMMPWFTRWEQTIGQKLILARQKFFGKFLVDGLLRGNVKDRFEAYRSAIMTGWMTRNEARAREDMNAIDGLDKPLAPLNMTTGNPPAAPAALLPAAGMNEEPPEPPIAPRLRRIAEESARNMARKEIDACQRAARKFAGDAAGWSAWVRSFYAKHAELVAERLALGADAARLYCDGQAEALIEGGLSAAEGWETEAAARLVELALRGDGYAVAA